MAVLKRVDVSQAERLFYPVTPVLVTVEYNGRVGGMLAAWWTQLSFKPFLVGVAIAPERFTYKLVLEAGVYGLNILGWEFVDKAPYMGDVSERLLPGKLERAGLRFFRGEELGVPLVEGALAALEVRLVEIHRTGDHDLFVGEVVSAYAAEHFDGLWDPERHRPLMYLGRTRRPGPVYRVYLTPRGFDVKRIEFAPGELKEYSKRRINILNAVRDAVKGVKSWDEAVNIVKGILRKHGLPEEDAIYYVDEVMRG